MKGKLQYFPIQLVAICNLTTRCHSILHTAPLTLHSALLLPFWLFSVIVFWLLLQLQLFQHSSCLAGSHIDNTSTPTVYQHCTTWIPDMYQRWVERGLRPFWKWELWVGFATQISSFSLFPSDPVFPRCGTVQTGPMRWRSGVFWSAPGCLQTTCPTFCSDHSTAWPATGPTSSARRL